MNEQRLAVSLTLVLAGVLCLAFLAYAQEEVPVPFEGLSGSQTFTESGWFISRANWDTNPPLSGAVHMLVQSESGDQEFDGRLDLPSGSRDELSEDWGDGVEATWTITYTSGTKVLAQESGSRPTDLSTRTEWEITTEGWQFHVFSEQNTPELRVKVRVILRDRRGTECFRLIDWRLLPSGGDFLVTWDWGSCSLESGAYLAEWQLAFFREGDLWPVATEEGNLPIGEVSLPPTPTPTSTLTPTATEMSTPTLTPTNTPAPTATPTPTAPANDGGLVYLPIVLKNG